MGRLRLLFVPLVFILSYTHALAGRYVLKAPYEDYATGGGPAEITGPSGGPPWKKPYTSDATGRGGGGYSSDPPPVPGMSTPGGSGSVSCSGTIVIYLTWVPDYPGEPTPKSVVVREYASASWSGTMGSCSSGLPDPVESSGPYSGSSVSTRYRVVNDPGTVVLCSASPGASANLPISPNEEGQRAATAGVRFEASATPVVLSLSGVIRRDGIDNVLIGQKVIGGISAEDCTFVAWQWNVSGDTYKYWNRYPSAYDGIWPLGVGSWTSGALRHAGIDWEVSSPYWRWAKPSGLAETTTVQCTARVVTPDGVERTVTGEQRVKVWAPYFTFDTQPAPAVTYTQGQELVIAGRQGYEGPPNPVAPTPGMTFIGAVGTPTAFRAYQGPGEWCFGQLINLIRRVTKPSTGLSTFATDGYWLDNQWPYGGQQGLPLAQWEAGMDYTTWPDGVSIRRETRDTPGQGIQSTVSYGVYDKFKMYQMYFPPDNGTGGEGVPPSSDWAPLARFEWDWFATDDRPTPGDEYEPFSGPDLSSIGEGAKVNFPEFPEWLQVFTTTQI